jgi:hypothetical protein
MLLRPSEEQLVSTNVGAWLEDVKLNLKLFVDEHRRTRVVELAVVVGRGEERNETTVSTELVSILNYLDKM